MEKTIPLIETINSLTNGEFKFSLKSATLSAAADFCVIEILYKDGILLSKETKDMLESEILSMVPSSIKYEIKFVKNFISENRISEDFTNFLKKTYSSISFNLISVKQQNLCFFIDFIVDFLFFEHANAKNVPEIAEKYLKSLYPDYDFKCNMTAGEVYKEDAEKVLKETYKEEDVDASAARIIEYTDMVHLFGNEFLEPAGYIKDKTTIEDGAVICGEITNIKVREVKRKPKEKETLDEAASSEQNVEENLEEQTSEDKSDGYKRKLFIFELKDFTGSMSCLIFSNKETQVKLEKFDVGTVVAFKGKIQEDKFNGGLNMMIQSACYCSLPDVKEEVIIYHKEKPFYEFVKPEPVVIYEQNNLLDFDKEKLVPKFLQNKTYVCYDLETTGLYYEAGDRMVELGAVKIVDGKITEKFSSLINPEIPISAEASAVSGITDDDVKDAPKDYQVLQDFYKFKGDAILIGYNNIRFDNNFLYGQGKACRWDFSGPTEDVYNYAQKYVHGVKNYKNSTVYEKLFGRKFDNAHRAVYDAMASAESFIKIAEIMESEEV